QSVEVTDQKIDKAGDPQTVRGVVTQDHFQTYTWSHDASLSSEDVEEYRLLAKDIAWCEEQLQSAYLVAEDRAQVDQELKRLYNCFWNWEAADKDRRSLSAAMRKRSQVENAGRLQEKNRLRDALSRALSEASRPASVAGPGR